MENKRIDGEKIYLTPMTLEDAEEFVKWRNSEYVMSRFIIRKPFTIEEQNAWIKNKVLTGEVVQFIIWDKEDDVKIGSSYLINIDHNNKKCEYGMLLGEEKYAGGGRGTEMAKLTSDYALSEMNMNKVYCRILANNPASIRACEKGGFEKEGLLKQDVFINGESEDVYILAKMRK